MTDNKEQNTPLARTRKTDSIEKARKLLSRFLTDGQEEIEGRDGSSGRLTGTDPTDSKHKESFPFEQADVGATSHLASETIARLYEQQGLLEEAARIRGRKTEEGLWHCEPIESYRRLSADSVELWPDAESGRIEAHWSISNSSIEATKRSFPHTLAQDAGRLKLTLRILASRILRGSTHKTRQDTAVRVLRGAAALYTKDTTQRWACVAIGLKHPTGRFHPIAHSSLVELPK
jgi:hypothetical protein